MTEPMKSVSLEGLTVAERILLVEEIWDSIAAEQDALVVTPEQKEELDQRLADYEADPNAGSAWEEVKARLQRKA